MTPVRGHKGDEGVRTFVTQGEANRAGTVQPGESLGAGGREHLIHMSKYLVGLAGSRGNPAATMANWILSCICRGITSRDGDVIIPLRSALVRLHILCAVLGPTLQERCRVERGQKRARKIIKGLDKLPHEERLKYLGLFAQGRPCHVLKVQLKR